jgi:transposase
MGRNLFWLSDEQWARIEPHFRTDVRGVERQDDRLIISGIIHVLSRSGSAGSGIRACRCRLCDQTKTCDEDDRRRDSRVCTVRVGCR